MIDLKRYETLKTNVDRIQREHDRAEGALAQLVGRLKAEHGCDSLEEAEDQLVVLERKAKANEERYNNALCEFEEEWGEQIKG